MNLFVNIIEYSWADYSKYWINLIHFFVSIIILIFSFCNQICLDCCSIICRWLLIIINDQLIVGCGGDDDEKRRKKMIEKNFVLFYFFFIYSFLLLSFLSRHFKMTNIFVPRQLWLIEFLEKILVMMMMMIKDDHQDDVE